jgi:hypothetical protein
LLSFYERETIFYTLNLPPSYQKKRGIIRADNYTTTKESKAMASIMRTHENVEDSDDPFAGLNEGVVSTAPTLVSPLEYGTGIASIIATTTTMGSTVATDATQDETTSGSLPASTIEPGSNDGVAATTIGE